MQRCTLSIVLLLALFSMADASNRSFFTGSSRHESVHETTWPAWAGTGIASGRNSARFLLLLSQPGITDAAWLLEISASRQRGRSMVGRLENHRFITTGIDDRTLAFWIRQKGKVKTDIHMGIALRSMIPVRRGKAVTWITPIYRFSIFKHISEILTLHAGIWNNDTWEIMTIESPLCALSIQFHPRSDIDFKLTFARTTAGLFGGMISTVEKITRMEVRFGDNGKGRP